MAGNLLKKLPHTHMVVWNRSSDAAQALLATFPKQVTVAASPADVVRQCSTTFSMLSTEEASAAVFDKPGDGLLAGVAAGRLVVDCATLSPARMQTMGQQVAARGGRFLEAPVSGSKMQAEGGQLIFLCGGDAADHQRVLPGLEAMGKANFLFGDVGTGSQMKLVVNMIMGTMMSAFAEGLALCEASQLPRDKLLQVLELGAMANPMFKAKGPAMIAGAYPTAFPLKHAQKDMRLALALGKAAGLPLPTAAAANEQYLAVLAEHGDRDFSAVHAAAQRTC
jgi:glyoxylate/succinic semialdehyde reductase